MSPTPARGWDLGAQAHMAALTGSRCRTLGAPTDQLPLVEDLLCAETRGIVHEGVPQLPRLSVSCLSKRKQSLGETKGLVQRPQGSGRTRV